MTLTCLETRAVGITLHKGITAGFNRWRRARCNRGQVVHPTEEHDRNMKGHLDNMPVAPYNVDPTSHLRIIEEHVREGLEAFFPSMGPPIRSEAINESTMMEVRAKGKI